MSTELATIVNLINKNEIQSAIKLLKSCKNKDIISDVYFILGVLTESHSKEFNLINIEDIRDNAINWYSKAVNTPDAYHNLGTILVYREQYAEALPILEKAISMNPSNVKAMNNAAICCEMIGREDDAFNYFKKILDYDPINSFAHHNIGHTNAVLGNISIAKKHLELAYKYNPSYAETCYTLSVLYTGYTIFETKIADSIALLHKAHDEYSKAKGMQLLLLTNELTDNINYYEFNNCVISSGRIIVNETGILLTHHYHHIPVQRWSVNKIIHQLPVAWTTLQHNSWGFYHWICETLPRLLFILDKIDESGDFTVPILVPDKSFVIDMLSNLDKTYNFIYCKNDSSYHVDTLRLVDWNTITDYQIESVEFLPPQFAITRLLEHIKPSEEDSELTYDVIWLSRRIKNQTNNKPIERHIDNEDKIFDIIKALFPTALFFVPEEHNYEDTKKIFSNAKIIIGIHGAALANMIYSSEAIIIEFLMFEPYYHYYFKHLAKCCGHHYIGIQLCEPNIFRKTITLADSYISQLKNILLKCT